MGKGRGGGKLAWASPEQLWDEYFAAEPTTSQPNPLLRSRTLPGVKTKKGFFTRFDHHPKFSLPDKIRDLISEPLGSALFVPEP